MQENKFVKACNFYVSEWHLFAALLPYLKDELKKNHKIIFISQDKLENGLRELVEKTNIKFENENGLNDIIWINQDFVSKVETECVLTSIIVQGTYEFIGKINELLDTNLLALYKECRIINCFDVFETNAMLHNILEKHDYVFNTGGMHKKEEIFPEYNSSKIVTGIL